MLKSIINSFDVYKNRKFITVFFLGLASGLPFNLVAARATFGFWLSYSEVALSVIGLAVLITLPYNLKFLWAPLVDIYKIPFLSNKMGNKRAWALLFQIGLLFSILGLSCFNPAENIKMVLILGALVAFFSSSQDIVIDALRVKILDDNEQGAGISVVTVGYRVGLFMASAVALMLVPYVGWNFVYMLAGFATIIGIITIFYCPKTEDENIQIERKKITFIEPFLEFTDRQYWLLFLLFIFFFKLGNFVLAAMAAPFYVDLGFSEQEIAFVSRTIGFFVTLISGIIGGAIIYKIKNIFHALFFISFMEIITSLAFVIFSNIGYSMPIYIIVTIFDNTVGGIGGVFLISFLIKLCAKEYTATQYAFLISLSTLSGTIVSAFSGYIADYLGWQKFFIFDAFLMVPGVLLLLWLYKLKPKI